MNIVPKISESDIQNIENYKGNIKDKIEIQLLSEDLLEGLENVKQIINKLSSLKYVVLHMPFSMLNICYIHSSIEIERKFIQFVVEVIKYSLKMDIEIDILFHVVMRIHEFKNIGGLSFLEYLCTIVKDTKVGFLLENSIRSLNIGEEEISSEEYIFTVLDNEKLNFCFDICHLQASENVLQREIVLGLDLLNHLKNIHFSMTLNNDGYREKKKTHGKGHISLESCFEDLRYLQRKGINLEKINIVTEINEKDYKLRPDMCKEIKYLQCIQERSVL